MKTIEIFFDKTPALRLALVLLFGALIAFGIYSALIPLGALFFFLKNKARIIFLSIFLLSFFFVKMRIAFPESGVTGAGHFRILSMKEAKKGWTYKAKVLSFTSDGKDESSAHGMICSLYSPFPQKTDHDYVIHGTLKEGKGKVFFLKTKEKWQQGDAQLNLVKRRYSAKEWVRKYLEKVIPHKKACALLAGLATGELKDPELAKIFEVRGLSHLLAVSGFHFAMLAMAFHFILRLFLPSKVNATLLILLLTFYFLFIGKSPSVLRAWTVAMVTLFGLIIEKRAYSINSLGIALCVGVLIDPLSVLNIGFQLSFLATAGILFLFSPFEILLRGMIPKKNIIYDFCREGLALGLAVNVAIIFHLLSAFHKMPWHGFFYNLFVPLLITVSFLLLIFAGVVHLLWPMVGEFLHSVNSYYTEAVLKLLEWPLIPHKTLYVGTISEWVLVGYLMVLFGGALALRSYFERKREESRVVFFFF